VDRLGAARGDRPLAAAVRLRVRPTSRTALPDDEMVVVDATADTAVDGPPAALGDHRRVGETDVVEVVVDGWRFELEVENAARAELRERATRRRAAVAGEGPLEVRAIIPGRVVSVAVATGDAVTAGQPLLVLEAMKMQNELRASRDGTVARVATAPGTTVEVGDLLLVLE
jgi:biotin carboxyl carrier protein